MKKGLLLFAAGLFNLAAITGTGSDCATQINGRQIIFHDSVP